MKKFIVTVSGVSYEVDVQEVDGDLKNNAPSATFVAPASAPAPVAAPVVSSDPEPAPAVSQAQSAAGEAVLAPMPGTILEVSVNVGDKVEKHDVVCVLEAMKMENDIVTPVAGTVVQVGVSKGSLVNSGDLLVVIS